MKPKNGGETAHRLNIGLEAFAQRKQINKGKNSNMMLGL